jgi:hypothetical protein
MICTGRTALKDGDRISIGPVAIVFRASRADLSTETAQTPVVEG